MKIDSKYRRHDRADIHDLQPGPGGSDPSVESSQTARAASGAEWLVMAFALETSTGERSAAPERLRAARSLGRADANRRRNFLSG
mmetsp:Transcript_10522/g.26073  ORF Transcript_10522/g.26073 Transcript_10522/m.26073 type:complete len:85 (-) Transcript_10522:4318-4572(-)